MSGIGMSILSSSAPLRVTARDVNGTDVGLASSGLIRSGNFPLPQISGGAGGYTQVWTRVSGSGAMFISSPTALNPIWSAAVDDAAPEVAVFRITVTDAVGSTAFFDITVTLTWFNFS